jgi:hypothetical protein
MTAPVPLSERLNALLGDDPAAMLAYYRERLLELKAKRLEAAKLAAWFESRGNNMSLAESERKTVLARAAHRLRTDAPPTGIAKWTDSAVDEAAHRDKDYTDWLAAQKRDRERWEEMKAETEHLEGVLKYLDHRLHLVRSSLFFLGQEANLER